VPLSKTGAEVLFEMLSAANADSTMVASNPPSTERTEVLGSERITPTS
jgi:hypothetical protein